MLCDSCLIHTKILVTSVTVHTCNCQLCQLFRFYLNFELLKLTNRAEHSDSSETDICDFYLENVLRISDFVTYFVQKAHFSLICECKDSKLALFT